MSRYSNKKEVCIGIRTDEGQRRKNPGEAMTIAGINDTYLEPQAAAYGWLTWRKYLHEFAPIN